MKKYILDLTYKDATLINSNDEISIVPSNDISFKSINNHCIDLNNSKNCLYNNRNSKFNPFSFIDYL